MQENEEKLKSQMPSVPKVAPPEDLIWIVEASEIPGAPSRPKLDYFIKSGILQDYWRPGKKSVFIHRKQLDFLLNGFSLS